MSMEELRDYVEDLYVSARLERLNSDLGGDGNAGRYYAGQRDAYQKVLEWFKDHGSKTMMRRTMMKGKHDGSR